MKASERFLDAVRSRIEPEVPHAEALRLARGIAERGGPGVLAVVFFGSRKTQAQPDPYSAYDFFVVTENYRGFYESLRSSGALSRNPALVAALNVSLPPNQIRLVDAVDGTVSKCSIIRLDHFVRSTSERRKDHFAMGRLFQPTEIAFARSLEVRAMVREAIVAAHVGTFEWIRPSLPARFTTEEYGRTLLRVSLSQEIRPESQGRVEELYGAQKYYLDPVYGILLEDLADAHRLTGIGGGAYGLPVSVGFWERLGTTRYFRWSLVRATVRWAKYMVTFEGWLDYIVRKVERRTGTKIVLTPRERRYPLLFLWPRLVRFLREKDL